METNQNIRVIVIVIAGAPGSGKTTLSKKIKNDYPQSSFSRSATTRKPGKDEKHGEDYFFIETEIEFRKMERRGEFVEHVSPETSLSNNYYGTLKSEIERIARENKIAILDVDLEGLVSSKKLYGDNCLGFYIVVSEDDRRERLRMRGRDTEDDIEMRLLRGNTEQSLTQTGAFRRFIDIRLENENGKFDQAYELMRSHLDEFLERFKEKKSDMRISDLPGI